MIYTTYFDNISNIKLSCPSAKFVSIAGKTPDQFLAAGGLQYKKLAPHYAWWNEWHLKFKNDLNSSQSQQWYIEKYYKTVLSFLTPDDVNKDIRKIAGTDMIFLVCYELPDKFCHRHIVSDWFTKNNIQCKEWTQTMENIEMNNEFDLNGIIGRDDEIKLSQYYDGDKLKKTIMLMEQFYGLSHDQTLDEKNRICAKQMFEHERRLAVCILLKTFKDDFKPDEQIINANYMKNMYQTFTN